MNGFCADFSIVSGKKSVVFQSRDVIEGSNCHPVEQDYIITLISKCVMSVIDLITADYVDGINTHKNRWKFIKIDGKR